MDDNNNKPDYVDIYGSPDSGLTMLLPDGRKFRLRPFESLAAANHRLKVLLVFGRIVVFGFTEGIVDDMGFLYFFDESDPETERCAHIRHFRGWAYINDSF